MPLPLPLVPMKPLQCLSSPHEAPPIAPPHLMPTPFSSRYAVFGLGSRAYPNFCTFAHTCDNLLKDLGAEQICSCGEGDELCGQEESFQFWLRQCYQVGVVCGVWYVGCGTLSPEFGLLGLVLIT